MNKSERRMMGENLPLLPSDHPPRGEQYLPLVSEKMVKTMETESSTKRLIDKYRSFSPEKTIAIYHGTKGNDIGVAEAIVRSPDHAVIQNSNCFALTPAGVFWNKEGIICHVPRGEIAFPGESTVGKKFGVDERFIVGKLKDESTPISLIEYEGRIAITEGADLSPESKERLIQLNMWLEMAYRQLHPIKREIISVADGMKNDIKNLGTVPENVVRLKAEVLGIVEKIDFSRTSDIALAIDSLEKIQLKHHETELEVTQEIEDESIKIKNKENRLHSAVEDISRLQSEANLLVSEVKNYLKTKEGMKNNILFRFGKLLSGYSLNRSGEQLEKNIDIFVQKCTDVASHYPDLIPPFIFSHMVVEDLEEHDREFKFNNINAIPKLFEQHVQKIKSDIEGEKGAVEEKRKNIQDSFLENKLTQISISKLFSLLREHQGKIKRLESELNQVSH